MEAAAFPYDTDLYSDDVIAAPYAHYRALRDRGAVAWLPRNGMYVMSRFSDVRRALRNTKVFSSASGVSANDLANANSKGILIASDPPGHTATRQVVAAPMYPKQLDAVRGRIEQLAEELVERLVAQRRFEAVTELAQVLPLAVVSELVGLPDEGRERMLEYGTATFDAGGAYNERCKAAQEGLARMRQYLFQDATRDKVRPGSWISQLFDASDQGLIPASRCPVLMRDYVGPSLDTTILATANLIWLFGLHPEQWDLVRDDPSLISNALNEAIRLETPIRGFTRKLNQDCLVDDVTIPAESRVLLLYGSANRDERRWDDPEAFDVRRPNSDHLGFGHGIHICAGMHLARLEIHALLKALVRRVARFRIEESVLLLNNNLRGLSRLTVSVS